MTFMLNFVQVAICTQSQHVHNIYKLKTHMYNLVTGICKILSHIFHLISVWLTKSYINEMVSTG